MCKGSRSSSKILMQATPNCLGVNNPHTVKIMSKTRSQVAWASAHKVRDPRIEIMGKGQVGPWRVYSHRVGGSRQWTRSQAMDEVRVASYRQGRGQGRVANEVKVGVELWITHDTSSSYRWGRGRNSGQGHELQMASRSQATDKEGVTTVDEVTSCGWGQGWDSVVKRASAKRGLENISQEMRNTK